MSGHGLSHYEAVLIVNVKHFSLDLKLGLPTRQKHVYYQSDRVVAQTVESWTTDLRVDSSNSQFNCKTVFRPYRFMKYDLIIKIQIFNQVYYMLLQMQIKI